MRLTPCEVDKLNVLVAAGQLAQRRLARGLRLNHPEAVALLAMQCVELARDPHFEKDGVRQALTLAEVQDMGKRILGRRHVLDGVPELVGDVQIETTTTTTTTTRTRRRRRRRARTIKTQRTT